MTTIPVWVVFRDATQPNSEVLGVAQDVEGIINVIESSIPLNIKTVEIKFTYSDVLTLEAVAEDTGMYGRVIRRWTARNFDLALDNVVRSW